MKKILLEALVLTKKPSSVCYECEKRKAGCHVMCPDYISYREKLDEYNKKVFENRAGEQIRTSRWTKSTRKRVCGR